MNIELLQSRFHGTIKAGKHKENSDCCILEYASVCRGIPWTDDPEQLRCFDIRQINDACWPNDELRTEWMIKLYDAIEGSLDWPIEVQKKFILQITIETMRQLISNLPGLPHEVVKMCKAVQTLKDVIAASYAVANAADKDAAYAIKEAAIAANYTDHYAARCAVAHAHSVAYSVSVFASYAAMAVANAVASTVDTGCGKVSITACKIWIDASANAKVQNACP